MQLTVLRIQNNAKRGNCSFQTFERMGQNQQSAHNFRLFNSDSLQKNK
jgi:hypothetical protein